MRKVVKARHHFDSFRHKYVASEKLTSEWKNIVTNETQVCPKCNSTLPSNAPAGMCPKCLMQAGVASASAEAGSPYSVTTPTPNSGFELASLEELAKQFPQLEILELLGRGGMGAVYKARQTALDRMVALKILPAEFGADPAFAERFGREARALAKLSHQNIVNIFDFGDVDGQFYFIMECVDGTDLRHLMESKVPQNEALEIIKQICEALQFAHHEGVVHRDIKPENVLVDKHGRVKIADFGLAKLLVNEVPSDASLTGTQQVMGTLRYMAPEQMTSTKTVDHRADIFSLGVIFYELLTGELPVGRFEPPSQKVQSDVRLDEVVMRALEQEPRRRYQQASEVNVDIMSIDTSDSSSSQPGTSGGRGIRDEGPVGQWELPRFSRKAIIGAAWASTFFVAVIPSVLVASTRISYSTSTYDSATGETLSSGGGGVTPAWYLLAFATLALLPFGATAPFGTTILGVVSLSQIRESRGKLIGLPLALADVLLFPLLLLDSLVLAIGYLGAKQISDSTWYVGLLVVTVIAIVVSNVLIIRWSWRHALK